jgi:histidinol-phosphatase (PHP family)
MPGYDIIRLYKELGGEIITVGSDAHISHDAGKGIREAIQMIEFAGFKFMTVYKNRQPSMIKISDHPSILSVGVQSA